MTGAPRRGVAAATALAAALGIASCAPHRLAPLPLDAGAREARFGAALARRETLGRAADAEVTLWLRSARARPWPAATGILALAGPGALRLRVASLFGTALDLGARGDSVIAHLPARRLGVAADAARDSLAVRLPGELGFRAFAAAWRPPAEAWAGAAWSESLLTLRWAEADDSLEIAVGSDGLPAWVELTRGDSLRVRARYRSWLRQDDAAWPSLIEFGDGAGELSLRCRIDRVRFRERPDSSRLIVRLPAGTWTVDWPGFRRALERARDERDL